MQTFWLEKWLEIIFDSVTFVNGVNYPFLNIFTQQAKPQVILELKLEPRCFLLNRAPGQRGRRSRYVVRTQPADACLSTVESVAEALAAVEEGWSGEQVDALCAPLDAMCNIQG